MPIRLRLALVVAAATILLAAVGGLLAAWGLRTSLLRSVDQELANRAVRVVQVLHHEDEVELDELREQLAATRESFAQVLDPSGRPVAAAPGLAGQRLVPGSVLAGLTTRPVGFQQRVGAEQVRLLAVPVTRPEGRYVVVVGSSLSTAQAALDRVRAGLLLGGVVVVVFGSLGAWLLAGAALRPVERLRAAVAAVPPNQPGRALQVPGTRDELAALAQTMNQLLGRISRTLERERRLIADASHELRTPLTVLRTELELADRPGRDREELAESVHHGAAEASRIARLAEDLLFLARSDQGGPVVRPTRQLLAPLLDGAIAVATGRAAACGVQLELQVDQELDAPIDADRLRQAVDNLLDNALRVAPAGSTIEVRAQRHDGVVLIAVSDAGPGFPAEFLPHAFERFHRADTTRTRQDGGAGLGLAIVEAIARGHGGHAEAANRADGGAVVRLLLPAG
jgi:two-component system OmpR family sensor kinase